MKKLFIALICLSSLGTISAQAQEAQAQKDAAKVNANAPKFKFKDAETYDFGTIKEGVVMEHKFEFTNTGKEPLIIQNASASCGCTTPDWPKEPILPGKKGVITVKFNSQGRVGPVMKDVYIQSNASANSNDRYQLHIKGNVEKAETPVATPAGH